MREKGGGKKGKEGKEKGREKRKEIGATAKGERCRLVPPSSRPICVRQR